jgi:hypothetical protein
MVKAHLMMPFLIALAKITHIKHDMTSFEKKQDSSHMIANNIHKKKVG